jgi:hypothetical protein
MRRRLCDTRPPVTGWRGSGRVSPGTGLLRISIATVVARSDASSCRQELQSFHFHLLGKLFLRRFVCGSASLIRLGRRLRFQLQIGLLRWKEPENSSLVPKQSADANQGRSPAYTALPIRLSIRNCQLIDDLAVRCFLLPSVLFRSREPSLASLIGGDRFARICDRCFWPHLHNSAITGASVRPWGVSEYSTFGGT